MNESIRIVCPKELNFLRPKALKSLSRVGNLGDGGYALDLNAIANSEYFLSLGLGENWSFEKAISQINTRARIDIYDHSISLAYFFTKAIKGLLKFCFFRESRTDLVARFYRLWDYQNFWAWSSQNHHHEIRITADSFRKILLKYPKEGRIGLKIDIEGSEWDILTLVSQNQKRFEFILIEIHDFDNHVEELRLFLASMEVNFFNAHLHANNFDSVGKNGFPKVFELTLIKKSKEFDQGENRHFLPVSDLDVPNAKNRRDYVIEFN